MCCKIHNPLRLSSFPRSLHLQYDIIEPVTDTCLTLLTGTGVGLEFERWGILSVKYITRKKQLRGSRTQVPTKFEAEAEPWAAFSWASARSPTEQQEMMSKDSKLLLRKCSKAFALLNSPLVSAQCKATGSFWVFRPLISVEIRLGWILGLTPPPTVPISSRAESLPRLSDH